MDIQTRKINFVQEFLKLRDEKVIALFEKLMKKEIVENTTDKISPMSPDEFNKRIDKSLKDSKAGRLTEVSKLISEIKTWD